MDCYGRPKKDSSNGPMMSASDDIKSAIRESEGAITLNKVITPESARGKGLGTKFMKGLIGRADQSGKRIELTPSADFGGNKNRLVKFYKGLGFVENKGKNKDYEISESMYRLPE